MLSYSRGQDAPLLQDTIDQVFRRTVQRHSGREALIVRHQKARLTFAELDAAVERTARALTGLGLGATDRVGVWSTNCVEWVMLHLACARIGAVLVNVNPAYRAYELRYVLEIADARLVPVGERSPLGLSRDLGRGAAWADTAAGARCIYRSTILGRMFCERPGRSDNRDRRQ